MHRIISFFPLGGGGRGVKGHSILGGSCSAACKNDLPSFFMTYQVELVREMLEPERLSAGLVFSKPEIFRQEIFQGASVHEE